MADSSTPMPGADKKKRKHRAGRKKKNRRQSFAAPSETSTMPSMAEGGPIDDPMRQLPSAGETTRHGLFRRGTSQSGFSDDSLDSDALLDHRDHGEGISQRPRRESRTNTQSMSQSYRQGGMSGSATSALRRADTGTGRAKKTARMATRSADEDDGDEDDGDERTPLMTGAAQHKSPVPEGYGIFKVSTDQHERRDSDDTATDRRRLRRGNSFPGFEGEYNVNNPPSVPTSPHTEAQQGYGDVMVPSSDFLTRSPDSRRNLYAMGKDALIDIDGDDDNLRDANSAPPSPRLQPDGMPGRRRTINLPASGDVCFPPDAISDMAEEDFHHEHEHHQGPIGSASRRRNRRHGWPELWVLEEWAREEKEERLEGIRAKKISEPVLVGGRLRPAKRVWHRTEEDVPYRYTYFNEEFESTIHAQTISELVQPGSSFRELFIPEPPEIDESSSEEEDENNLSTLKERDAAKDSLSPKAHSAPLSPVPQSGSRLNSMTSTKATVSRDSSHDHPSADPPSRQASVRRSGESTTHRSGEASASRSGEPSPPLKPHPITAMASEASQPTAKAKRYGPRPTFWLDVMSPTDQEMRVLCKTFGIHALTSEDIMMQEAREKVELFRNYYFINYRTFEQDTNSDDYLDPINMYVCVFRHGIISFHFSQIPHPANVRRRIRQLTDYLILSSDWISYAIIDDITDVYQPLIHAIEHEVDDIDEIILNLIQGTDDTVATAPEPTISGKTCEKHSETSSIRSASSGINLLRRIGETRKKVMSLYRLLGNKADVIKGFAKRCNEQWEVAPRSEIGLYLGDIQDHILTMTSNLSHYETLLSRAHSNYLAQINIRMNERQEQTADVLGKLTVVGTIVLPMNIICGMWGMNVKVPGQDVDSLIWFWSITAGLLVFAVGCFYWCKRVYGIV